MKKLVHIIEDDPDILSLLSLVLRSNQFEVIMDFNGNNFNIKAERCPDVYIIDVNLIDKNGADLCKQIKTAHPHIPVILMSANFHLHTIASESRADRFIPKPFSISHVVETVTALTANNA